jgi:phytol kinase
MIGQIIFTFLLFCGFMGILVLSELIYKKFNLQTETTRKMSHIVATLSCLLLLVTIESHWYILVLGVFFFLLLYIGKKNGLFKSINAVERKTGGSYLLPVAIYISFLVYDILDNSLYFVLPVVLLAICDALAGLVGIQFKEKTSNIVLFGQKLQKTYLGSLTFLLSSIVICLVILGLYGYSLPNMIFWTCIIALVTTLTEMFSSRGLDNLTIPLVTILLLWISLS